MRFLPAVLILVALAIRSPVAAQTPAATVDLTGLDGQRATISLADLHALPRTTVQVVQHGAEHRYEGALLGDVLAKVRVPRDKEIHGAELADVVLIQARDGYKVALDLAGSDAATRTDRVILADSMDVAPLGEKQGPFQIVVEGDLRPARSARMVTAISVRRLD